MDDEIERLHACRCRSYRACWFGFSVYAFYLAVSTLLGAATLLLLFSGQARNPGGWLGIVSFESKFDAFRTWARLLACLSLAAAWPTDRPWRRRAGLLLFMAIGDVVLWAIEEAVPLGLASEATRHAVLCRYLREGLGWARFMLLASLAADFAGHAGVPRAAEMGKAALSTATMGAAVWFACFLTRVDWQSPWPLVDRRRLNRDSFHLLLVSWLIQLVCLAQASLLTFLAARSAAQLLHKTAREATGFDPWADSPSASGAR
jgi:hypothetical protein